jgi:leader peptidase (prepilin peptidase)/N-methyltransferase
MNLLRKYSLNLITAGLWLLSLACLGLNPVLLGVLPFIFGGVLLTIIDWRYHRLPTRLVYLTLVGCLIGLAAASLIEWDWKPGLTALVGAGIYGGAMCVLWYAGSQFLGMRLFGYGDVRLALVLGLLLGWFGLPTVYYGAAAGIMLAGVMGIGLAIKSRRLRMDMAFGPPLMIGAFLIILAH